MNIKQLLVASGGIALSLSCLTLAPVQAQTGTTAPAPMERGGSQLNLSADQQTQMQQIRKEADAQVKQILTPDQQTKLQSLKQNGKLRMDWQSLNLSAQQKQDLRKVMEKSRQRMLTILTEDQRKLLQQQEQSMKAHHQRSQPQTPTQAQ